MRTKVNPDRLEILNHFEKPLLLHDNFDQKNFRHCYGNFFEIAVLKATWS